MWIAHHLRSVELLCLQDTDQQTLTRVPPSLRCNSQMLPRITFQERSLVNAVIVTFTHFFVRSCNSNRGSHEPLVEPLSGQANFLEIHSRRRAYYPVYQLIKSYSSVLLILSTHPATDTFLTPSNHRLSLEYSSGKLFPLNDVLECHLCVLPCSLRCFWL